MKKFFRDIFKVIFPQVKCAVCSEKVAKEYIGLCENCIKVMEEIRSEWEFYDKWCTFLKKDKTYHHIKDNIIYTFHDAWALYPYKDEVKKVVHNFKYNTCGYLSFGMSKLMYDNMDKSKFNNNNYDLIIPVPLFKKKERSRGYNQSRLLAEDLGKLMNIPVDVLSLRRIKNTTSQTTLNAEERHDNLSMAFKIVDNSVINGKRIILVDDVITTGSTANACSTELYQAGAKSITFVAFAASAMD